MTFVRDRAPEGDGRAPQARHPARRPWGRGLWRVAGGPLGMRRGEPQTPGVGLCTVAGTADYEKLIMKN